MHVTECYEYEGKTVEQLASIFLEKNINLSIISPRKIPVLYELFEKSGGDLGGTSSKNYSKDPRHLVLLKGFSLKERPASPNVNSNSQGNQQVAQSQATQPNAPQPNPAQQPSQQQNQEQPQNMPMNPNQQIRPMRMANPMMTGQQPGMGMPGNFNNPAIQNFPNRPQNPNQQQQQPPNQMWGPNQPRQQFINNPNNIMGGGMVQGNVMQQQNPNQPQQQQQQQPNSALINQLNQPPSLPQMNPNIQNQPMVRMNQPMQMMPGAQQQGGPNMNIGQINQMMNQGNQQMQQGGPLNPQMNPNQMTMIQQPSQQPMHPQQGGMSSSECVWRGAVEWNDKQNQQNTVRQIQCEVHSSYIKDTREVEVRGDNWPQKLIMQLVPRQVITSVGGQKLRDSRIVIFQFGQPNDSLQALTKVLSTGFAGCVHFSANQCDVKILILLYMPEKKCYYGFIPNDQTGYVEVLCRVIQMSKSGQNMQNPNQIAGPRPAMGMNQMNPQGGGQMNPQQMVPQQGDQNQMMFNQQQQMQMQQGNPNMVGNVMMQGNQQRMQRPPMMQQNNLRHLLQQVILKHDLSSSQVA